MTWQTSYNSIGEQSEQARKRYEDYTMYALGTMAGYTLDAIENDRRHTLDYQQALKQELDKLKPDDVVDTIQGAYDDGIKIADNELNDNGLSGDKSALAKPEVAVSRDVIDSINAVGKRMYNKSVEVFKQAQAADSIEDAQRILDDIADTGITGFVDTQGNNWSAPAYIEFLARVVSDNQLRQGYIDSLLTNDHDLVIVSSHVGACPLCVPWQGKVLSLSGEHAFYPSLSAAKTEGLFHPNCRHFLHVYVGQKLEPNDYFNRLALSELQRQRTIEKQIRRWNRRVVVALTDAHRVKAKLMLAKWKNIKN